MSAYQQSAPTRAEVESWPGVTVIDFGTSWCGFCIAAQPHIEQALQALKTTYPDLRHLKVEDGPGRALGRSFRVKLWPTLIFMKDGKEVARVVRPASSQEIADAARQLDPH